MKTIARVMLGTVCIWLTGIVSAFGVNYWNFEADMAGWNPVNASIAYYPHSGWQSVAIGTMGSVSVNASAAGHQVTTDFWTVPNGVLGVPIASELDSVQFAFGTDGKLYYLNGPGTTFTATGGSVATINGSTWVHVMVIQDYDAGTWSLKINDALKVDGATLHGSQGTYVTFSIVNQGGTVMLDDVTILSAASGFSLADAGAKLSSGGVSGVHNDIAVSTPSSVADSVKVYSDYACGTLVTTLPLTQNGVVKDATLTAPDLASNPNLYFKLVAGTATESKPSFAVHAQDRSSAGAYWVGIPVAYSGDDVYLSGKCGEQLKLGFTPQDGLAAGGDVLMVFTQWGRFNYYLSNEGLWRFNDPDNGDTDTAVYPLTDPNGPQYVGAPGDFPVGSLGGAVVIQVTSGNADKAVFAGPQIDNAATVGLGMGTGWNMISWPFEANGSLLDSGNKVVGGDVGDLLYLKSGSTYKLLKLSGSGWKLFNSKNPSDPFDHVKFGDGMFYQTVGTPTVTLTP